MAEAEFDGMDTELMEDVLGCIGRLPSVSTMEELFFLAERFYEVQEALADVLPTGGEEFREAVSDSLAEGMDTFLLDFGRLFREKPEDVRFAVRAEALPGHFGGPFIGFRWADCNDVARLREDALRRMHEAWDRDIEDYEVWKVRRSA